MRAYNAGGCFSTSLPTTIVVVAAREISNNVTEEISAPSLELSAYPNPVHDLLNIDFNSEVQKSYTLSLLDIQGRVVYTRAFESEVGSNHIELNVSEYQKGIYFGYLTSDSEKRSLKVIVD